MILQNQYQKIKWINVETPSKSNLAYLHEEFDIRNEDLRATLPPHERPRLVVRENYLMMILQFPYYNKTTREIHASEIDFFITKNSLITVTDGKLAPLNELFDTIEENPLSIGKNSKDDMGNLIHEILNRLLDYTFPLLDHISQSLDSIEDGILDDDPIRKSAIKEILIIKNSIVDFRRIMQSHRDVITRLITHADGYFSTKKLEIYFNDLLEHTTEIWNALANYRDTIDTLHETYESLLSYQINIIMKRLNVFAVIVFPLTLLAAIFGMNTTNTPLVNHPYGFWIICIVMLVGVVVMWIYFRYKKWI